MIYGCEYVVGSRIKIIEFCAETETQARLKMMEFAEKEEVYVRNLGKIKRKR